MPTMHDSNEGQTQQMTDTQEAMREEFETHMSDVAPLWPKTQIDGEYTDTGMAAHWITWQAAAAQSAEKIARLEAENVTLRENLVTVRRQSAAAELSNKQLMDEVSSSMHAAYRYGTQDFGSCFRQELEELLAQQPSTEALDAYVAGKMEKLDAELIAQEKLIRILKGALSVAVTPEMVDRFLAWKLPKGFCPDAGISFNPISEYDSPHWPTGTNLFTAEQAREMLEHILADEAAPLPPAPEKE